MNMEIDPPKLDVEEQQIKDEDLFKAADSGDSSIFRSLSQSQLLKALSLRNEDGRSLLHVAASLGHTEVVRVLSASDPSVSGINSSDEEGWAPIHSAASSGRVETVEILLSRENSVEASVQPETAKKKRGTSFSIKEDVFLVTAWLNTSMDIVHGNNQNKNTFWGRVRQYYYQYKTFASERNERSLQQRWATIQHATNKFGRCYAQIEHLRVGEDNENDMITDAKSLYKSSHGKNFALEHCWHILRRHPKWFDEVSKQKPLQLGKGLHSSPSVSAPSTPTDLATNDVPNIGFVQRPLSWNAEKRKQIATEENEIPSNVMVDLINEMVEGGKKAEFIKPNMDPNMNPDFSNQSFESEFSQSSEFPENSAEASVQPETAKKKRGTSFSTKEDVFLVTAWLNTSMDSVHGNDQNKNTFWGRVRQYYYQYKTFASERNERSLQQRWATIQHATNKFGGCYAQIEHLHPGEGNENDLIADAKSLYESSLGKKFTLEHCWHILRRHPKWFDEVSKQKPPHQGKGLHSSLGVSSPITPSTPGTPTDLATNDVPNTGFVQRSPDRNVEKQKQRAIEENEIPSHVMVDLIKEMVEGRKKAEAAYIESLEEKKIASRRRLEIMEKQLEIELEKQRLEVEKQRVDRLANQERIMTMDTSGMPPDAQQYYSKLKMKILQGENYDA